MHPVTRFSFPTTIIYGPGAIRDIKTYLAELAAERPLIVTDSGFAGIPIYTAFLKILKDSGITWAEYNAVQPNPYDTDIQQAAEVFRNEGCDSIIGIGGGSAMDAAKAAAVLAGQGGRIEEYDVQKGGGDRITEALPPIIAVPTTAGTGSEVGKCAVVTSTAEKRKFMVCHSDMLPSRAVLDPELTISLPPAITAATGMDALTHSIESLASPVFHPLCDAIAIKGIQLVSENLEKAVKNPEDLDARGYMMISASMGAIAFQKDLGACHSLSHALSAVCSIPHGLANAVCLVPVMRFNLDAAAEVYAQTAAALGENVYGMSDSQAAELAVERIIQLNTAIGIPSSLRELQVREDKFSQIAATAYKDICHQTNPKPCTEDDFLYLLKKAWEGYTE
ncbi:MAG: iron-containing alcohol dehydrogenase [Spirochaetales bacterium]|nr:iron-containing alcohol dehydrogenase [Spirochaetales bacterium]